MINFDTTVLSLRYGVSSRVNVQAVLPYLSIVSDKIQGAPYKRTNRGLGDLTLTSELAVLSTPQVTVEMGVKLPTGKEDNVDDLGQRVDNILALGSGTTDFLLGGGVWIPQAAIRRLDVTARVQHRFVGGQDKYGYRFGDQTTYSAHATHSVLGEGRLGLKLEGFHTEPDRWYGHQVPERGATFLYAGPTASWTVRTGVVLGGFVRFPLLMKLEGAQMVAPNVAGMEVATDLTPIVSALIGKRREEP